MSEAVPEIEPLPPLPPNSAVLAVRAAPDRAHVFFRLNFDVTDLSDDGQKLLVHYMTESLTKFRDSIKAMNKIEVASALGKIERVKAMKKNGQPSNG